MMSTCALADCVLPPALMADTITNVPEPSKQADESSAASGQAPASAFAAAAVQAAVSPEDSSSSADQGPSSQQKDAGLNLSSITEADAVKLALILRHAQLLAAEKERASGGTELSSGRSTPGLGGPSIPSVRIVRAPSAPEQGAAGASSTVGLFPLPLPDYPPPANTITTGIPGLKGPFVPSGGAGGSFHRAASVPTYCGDAVGTLPTAPPLPRIVIQGQTVIPMGGGPRAAPLPPVYPGSKVNDPAFSDFPNEGNINPRKLLPGRRRGGTEAVAGRQDLSSDAPGSPLGDDSALAAELLLGFRDQSAGLPSRTKSAPQLDRSLGFMATTTGKRGVSAFWEEKVAPVARNHDDHDVEEGLSTDGAPTAIGPGLRFPSAFKRARSGVAIASASSLSERGVTRREDARGTGRIPRTSLYTPLSSSSARASPSSLTNNNNGSRAPSPGSRSQRLPGPQGPSSSRAPPGQSRTELARELGSPLERVERPITNGTYINRLHVTQQMAQLLFPQPEFGAYNRSLSDGGNFNSLFKHRLTIIDEAGEAWPVQYEGFMSSGQRHFRLTSGWSGLMRVQNVTVGDTLVLERWTEDRMTIHLRIERQRPLKNES